MNDLVLAHNNQAVVSSRVVAEKFNKKHCDVLDNIKRIVKTENSVLAFYEEHQYKVKGQYRSYPEYYMNRDGFMLLVMGFTTKPAMQVKIAFIKAFNEMEAKLQNKAGYFVPKDKVAEFDKHIQDLMNENDKLKKKIDSMRDFADLGWNVVALTKDKEMNTAIAEFTRVMQKA